MSESTHIGPKFAKSSKRPTAARRPITKRAESSQLSTGTKVKVYGPTVRMIGNPAIAPIAAAHTIGEFRSVSAAAAKAINPASEASEMTEIIDRVAEWAGGRAQAIAWYRSTPIPALGDQTAEAFVNTGRADLVRRYLNSIAEGGFA